MSNENLHNVIKGPDLERFIEESLGELLLMILNVYEDNILQIDGETDEVLRANILKKRAIRLAKWLQKEGISVGDSISVISENRLEFCIVPSAGFFVGATFAPLNPEYTPIELKHVLGLSKPKLVFCSDKTIDKMVSVLPEHPYINRLVLFGKEGPKHNGVIMYENIIEGADAEEIDEEFTATPLDTKEAVATILCSSGTTGLPKGVMCTHDSMTAFIEVARVALEDIVNDTDDTFLGLTPFFHSFGFMLMFLSILRGRKLVILGRFKPKVFLEALVKNRVTRLIVPPPVLLFLLKYPLVKNYDLSAIKEMRSGAAPIGKDLQIELREKFNIRRVSQAYGMTETTLGVLVNPEGVGKIGSCGKVVPGMLAKVIDEEGKALGPNEEGELCFKGPLIMKGYIGDPKSTHSTIDEDGWLHTGDVAYYDNDHYFFVVDRIKELIKYKAFQVAPAELEALLLTHHSVQDSAVIGLPNEDAGELPLAFVVKKSGTEVTEREIEKFIEDRVSPQKRLRGGVIFTNQILRNPTGKILRRLLKQQAIKLKSKL